MDQQEVFDYTLREIKKDTIFFDQSGGGATFSGGEPFMQPDLLFASLEERPAGEGTVSGGRGCHILQRSYELRFHGTILLSCSREGDYVHPLR